MITASIVTYKHTKEQLENLILSILKNELVHKLFIIDNSPASNLQSLTNYNKIDYYFLNKNVGYGAGHNVAIKKAIDIKSEYHLVVNPDVMLESHVIDILNDFMTVNKHVGNVMPGVKFPDGSNQYLCKLLPTPYDWIGRRFNPFTRLVNKRNLLFELRFSGYNRIMDVPYLSGCFMFLRISALNKIGLFDENIFMYGEETDLCRRLIQGGYRTVYYPDVSIVHEFQKGSHTSFRLTWIGIRSAIYYFNKWGWFFDSERRKINKKTLIDLGYQTIDKQSDAYNRI